MNKVWFFTSELEGDRASSFRQERWCQVFLDVGSSITVFNVRGAINLGEYSFTTLKGFRIFREQALANAPLMASVREGVAARLIRRVKHIFLIDLYLPNVIRLLIRTINRLRKTPGHVTIMASSPPFSVAVVGALLKIVFRKKITLIVDMRDAWALHPALGGVRMIKRLVEGVALNKADYLATVSFGLAEEFEACYGIRTRVMYNVATHYLDTKPAVTIDLTTLSPEISKERLQLVYTGSTPEGHYDVASIVGGMALLRRKFPSLADRVQLIFVGACDEIRREALRQRVGNDDLVFVGHVPHSTARSIQASADALMFLAHYGLNNCGVVSTKLFEYLCLGKPLIPFSLHANSDVDRLLVRYCQNTIRAHTPEEIAIVLAAVARDGVDGLPRLENVVRVRELIEDYDHFAREVIGALSSSTTCD
jgi:glycosyltransferase involved in cell wall biosynthesis